MADLKQLARRIFHDTLAAIDIPMLMRRNLFCRDHILHCGDIALDLRGFHKFHVIAMGKAAHAMVDGLYDCLPHGIALRGVVSAPQPPQKAHRGIQYFTGGHPTPNESSWKAAEAILHLLSGCDGKTLVLFLLSGGGSALVELPINHQCTLTDVQRVHRALVNCGAPIDAINSVRKHLSAVKGGRLATAAGGATKLTIAVSDVPPGKESALASGPTLPDPSSLRDVCEVMRQFSLVEQFPEPFRDWITGASVPETPKAHDPAFRNAHFFLLLGLDGLFHPAHGAAEAAGCITCCDNSADDWPIDRAADFLLAQLAELRTANPARRVAIIADGEVSSPVLGNGTGGRNSAFVLHCVEKIAGERIAVLSAGTDGIDGNSPAAGAVADGDTLSRATNAGLDPRASYSGSDAYSFFNQLNDTIVTGPTGNNLRDLRVIIAEP